ncbi:MAG: aminodeoxychorismate lyase [Bacteroidetes bacterium]|nr:aminodeoxychorismate lyase [Bacteroidota bacterium]
MAYYHSKYGTQKKRSRFNKFIIYLLGILIIGALGAAYLMYHVIYKSNVWIKDGDSAAIYIQTGATFTDVKNILYSNGMIIHRNNFEWLANKKKFPENIKAGKFRIQEGMSNNDLINHLRSGKQEVVKLIFNNIRSKEQLAKRISQQIEADSISIVDLLSDSAYMSKFNVDEANITTLFIPNTYNFFWNVNAEGFIERMHTEYQRFWNDNRKAKADALEMTEQEVITLASIVEKETQKNDEKQRLAGVYINRLNRGWRLQADPTLVFALGDFGIKRVLNEHKEIDSPYNTYKVGGLPPGPICIPSISSIDAVLNYESHNFLYFCAKADMSGYHAFAKNIREHNRNARDYQKELNKLRIYK